MSSEMVSSSGGGCAIDSFLIPLRFPAGLSFVLPDVIRSLFFFFVFLSLRTIRCCDV